MESSVICRLCAKNGDTFLDLLYEDQLDILKITERFFGLRIRNHDRFHHICVRCCNKLKEFQIFYKEIEKAQEVLQVSEIKSDNLEWDPYLGTSCEIKVETLDDTELKFDTKNDMELNSDIPMITVVNELPESKGSDHESEDDSEEFSENHEDYDRSSPQKSSSKTFKVPVKKEARDKAINKFYELRCPECSIKYSSWLSYKKHIIQKHDEPIPTINCCDIKLSMERRNLLGHVVYHKCPELLQCKCCAKQFLTFNNKRKHEWRLKTLKKEGADRRQKRVGCTECGKVMSVSSLKYHMRRHRPIEEKEKLKVQCDICQKFFRDKGSISFHMKDVHLKIEEPIACDQCAKIFTNARAFTYHYRAHHTPNNKVICPDCGLELKFNSLVKHRQRKHEVQPQICTTCNKEFKNKLSLICHQRRVHVEPKYACDVCGRMFKVTDRLKEHRDGHFTSNRYGCDQCDYVNNDYRNTLTHRKTKHPDAPPLEYGSGRKTFMLR